MNDEDLDTLAVALSQGKREPLADAARLNELAAEARARERDPARSEQWREDFDHCVHAIASTPVLLVAALAAWMTEEADEPLADLLLQRVSQNTLTQVVPADLPLGRVPVERAILVAYRLCSRFTPPAFSLGWLLSLARDFPGNAAVVKAVEHLLAHHAEEFSYSTRKLLEAETSVFLTLPVAEAMTAQLKALAAASAALPWLRELEMTPAMRLQHSSLKRSEQRDITRGARERSVLLQFAIQQRVKYARRVAVPVVQGDTIREMTMELGEYRLGIEPPLSDLTDPLYGSWRRKVLWRGPRS